MKDEGEQISGSSFLLPPSSFLRRHWFLIALVLGLGVAGLRPDGLRPLTTRVAPRGVVGLALFIMAWGLESRSLWRALLRPVPALAAVLVSYAALPALGW